MNPVLEGICCGLGIYRANGFLKRSRRWGPEQIRDYQTKQLIRTLQSAYEHSPYYRKKMEEVGFRPSKLVAPEEITALPLLYKSDVRANFSEIVSRKRSLFAMDYRTSGSTGEPLRYKKSFSNIAWEYAFHLRYFKAGGAGFGGRMVALRSYVPKPGQALWKKDPVFPVLWMSAYHLNAKTMDSYLEAIQSFRGDFLRGYPSSLYVLARYCQARGIKNLKFRAAFSSSEALNPERRRVIEEVFGCSVYEYYGLSENVVSSFQCEKADLFHINPEYGYFEVLKPDGKPAAPGESGVIVGTGFHNPVFPFIRYWTGDLCEVSKRDCSCGWKAMTVERILGREDDILLSAEGTPLPGVNFYSLFREIQSVENFQITQTNSKHMRLDLVTNSLYSEAEKVKILYEMQRRVGSGMEIQIQQVEELKKNSIGKVRSLIREFPAELIDNFENACS